jgi:ADP-ribosylglycohydrolase/protein-tyrosine phosphatase
LAQCYLAWYRDGAYTPDGDGRFDIGRTTQAALERLAQGVPATEAGPSGERDCGNGSLMRVLPIALASRLADEGALAARAHQASKITHGHPRAQVACALYTLLAQRLTNWSRRSNAIFAEKNTLKLIYLTSQAYAPHLAAFNDLVAWKDRTGSGYVLDSFWSAWDAVAEATGFEDAIRRAIAYGHDTDTTAALAGGLAGAHWGWESIPREWLRGMRGKTVVAPLLDRLLERETGTRTSTTSPLRINDVNLDGLPGLADGPTGGGQRGRLAITFLPGKKLDGWTGPHWRDLDADVERLQEAGTNALLVLVEDHELEAAMVLDLPAVLAEAGIELVRFPIPDPRVPVDGPAFRVVVEDVVKRMRRGQTVAVACRGGLDRSGMTAACVLRELGVDTDAAVGRVHAARDHSLTRDEQLAYVRDWSTANSSR